ncbi:hypothetical protein BH11PAT3_BH11PAT3_1820 [soil metagenome]
MSLTRRYFRLAKKLEAAYGVKDGRKKHYKKLLTEPKPHRKPAAMRATR